jgi:single-strand DNA-binding protein
MSINRCILSGNLTRDPELRSTAGGTSVLSFGIAVNDRRKNNQTGEWEDYPNFVDCTMFGARAEAVGRFLAKGNKVAIEGKLRYSSWEKDGQRRSKLEVVVDEIEFMSHSDREAAGAPVDHGFHHGFNHDSQQEQPQQQWSAKDAYDDIPFDF